ncbi:MAG: hypothetical protein H0T71_04725 [Acidobacteria bacterium]|nr:hypothetical protein [Acidobacteriota bacterium]
MSRQNKVNPAHYTLAGRLSPDDLARERRKQSESNLGRGRASARKATPPWHGDGQDDSAHRGHVNEDDRSSDGNEQHDADQRETDRSTGEMQAGAGETAAQQPQRTPQPAATGKQSASKSARSTAQMNRPERAPGKKIEIKTERRTPETRTPETRTGAGSRARSSAASQKTASRGTQGRTPAQGPRQAAGSSGTKAARETSSTKKGSAKKSSAKKSTAKKGSAKKSLRGSAKSGGVGDRSAKNSLAKKSGGTTGARTRR